MSEIYIPTPSIEFLRSFLSPRSSLANQYSIQKAVRGYVYVKAIYDNEGLSLSNGNYLIKYIPFADRLGDLSFSPSSFFANCIDFRYSQKIVSSTIFKQPSKLQDQIDKQQKMANIEILSGMTIKEILFGGETEQESDWKRSFITNYQNISHEVLEELLNLHPFQVTEKKYRQDFEEILVGNNWLVPKSPNRSNNKDSEYFQNIERLKPSGAYYKISVLDLNNKLTSISKQSENIITHYFSDVDLASFINRFARPENSKLFFESEFLISCQVKLEQVLAKLEKNWFDSAETRPLKLKYKNINDRKQIEEFIVYPVTFVYIKRTPYLYAIASSELWKLYRLDRIDDVEILDWEGQAIPKNLKELKNNEELPTSENIQDELGQNILGYAFWKPTNVMLVRFDRDHYNNHIKDNSRSEIFDEIDSTNFKQAFKRASFVLTLQQKEQLKNQIQQTLDRASDDKSNYVYCLAKYYENEMDVRLRLLSWGKKVKVIFPESLKQEILEEIYSTIKLYDAEEL